MSTGGLSGGDAKTLGRLRVYRGDDPTAPPKLIDLEHAKVFGFERVEDGWRPKFVFDEAALKRWGFGNVLVKPHDGPWLLVWRAGLGLAPSDRFVYQAIDEQEAAEFALSRGYVPAELRELVADRCLGKPPCDEQGDEVEIKRFLWLQGKTHDTAVQTLPGATGPFMPAPAELTSAEFPAADESVSRLPPAGYLGLRVDDARRTITRDGFPATVNLQDSRILWAIFKKLVLNHDVPVAHEAIVGLWEANGVARMPSVGTVNDAVAELRNQLKAIGITIEVKRKVGRLLAELPLPADKAKARRPKKKK